MTIGAIRRLTPYMLAYDDEFADDGTINWLPYTMYFHPFGYRSEVVNTDRSGFRYSGAEGKAYAVADHVGIDRCCVVAGSSTVFGIGASSDRFTLASSLTEHDPRGVPWFNFGGRSFNSTQEMILFSLHRHHLPTVEEVVLLSGFNDLGLARLPRHLRLEHGAFFMCNDFFDAMRRRTASRFSRWFDRHAEDAADVPSLGEQIDYAANLTLRNLTNWRAMCTDMGAKLTFVLQPLANWIRETGSPEEEELFAERESRGGFVDSYGDVLTQDSYVTYRDRLRAETEGLGITFVDLTSHLRSVISDDFWLFVDRIHFTDQGHDRVSRLLIDLLRNQGGSSWRASFDS